MARTPAKSPSRSATRPVVPRPPSKKPALKKRSPPARGGRTGPAAGPSGRWGSSLLWLAEVLLLASAGLIATISVLGRAANWFGGTGLTESLLPFSGTVLFLAISASVLMWLWGHSRRWLRAKKPTLPVITAGLVAFVALVFAFGSAFEGDLSKLRVLVGGTEEAGRVSVAHQVFAAYRRADLTQLQTILARAKPYLPAIGSAARDSGIDEDILVGIAVTESSFVPRESKDGGQGLFQITAVPKSVRDTVRTRFAVSQPDPRNPAHNAQLAAETFRHYLADMNGDLFLGLLAYNIGPRNGGLRSIMNQYGARDFFTIQPYLKDLPRDYPIRVLTAALAARLWREQGSLPHYEDGLNARYIQEIGIPGLQGAGGESLP